MDTPVPAVLVTTIRTLQATEDDVDFRGLDPAFVLIDSDALMFLRHSQERQDVIRNSRTWSTPPPLPSG